MKRSPVLLNLALIPILTLTVYSLPALPVPTPVRSPALASSFKSSRVQVQHVRKAMLFHLELVILLANIMVLSLCVPQEFHHDYIYNKSNRNLIPSKDIISHLRIKRQRHQLQFLAMIYSVTIDMDDHSRTSTSQSDAAATAKFIITIRNNGPRPEEHPIEIYDCTDNSGRALLLGVSHRTHQIFRKKLIQPQSTRTYEIVLELKPRVDEQQLISNGTCSVGVLNPKHEVIASRSDIQIVTGQTCICYFACRCICLSSNSSTTDNDNFPSCSRLTTPELIKAGFTYDQLIQVKSSTEEVDDEETKEEEGLSKEIRHHPFLSLITFVTVLLALGFVKDALGLCCCPKLAQFGLGYFYDKPRTLNKYYERQYSKIKVVYDEFGYPVDPFTKLSTVQRLGNTQQLAYNTVFFIIWPLLLCHCCCNWCSSKSGTRALTYKRVVSEEMELGDVNHGFDDEDDEYQNVEGPGPGSGERNGMSTDDEEVVHFDRTNNAMNASEAYRKRGSSSTRTGSYHKDDEEESEFRQYGSQFFIDRNELGLNHHGIGIGSMAVLPSRKDSNVSISKALQIQQRCHDQIELKRRKQEEDKVIQYKPRIRRIDDEEEEECGFTGKGEPAGFPADSKSKPTSTSNQAAGHDPDHQYQDGQKKVQGYNETDRDHNNNISSNNHRSPFSVKSKYGSWHRTPSDWSMSGVLHEGGRDPYEQRRKLKKYWEQISKTEMQQ